MSLEIIERKSRRSISLSLIITAHQGKYSTAEFRAIRHTDWGRIRSLLGFTPDFYSLGLYCD
jgi:hypothetical protein